ncbi:MAG: hypothetical protein NTW87_27115, partial [Planctomycetota bacterium]|nr:hypothetical protein [Planctomycetota bacterium]
VLAGAAAMALELALLSACQAACGYVYERIGLIIGLYMLGLAVGNRWASGLLQRGTDARRAAWQAQRGLCLCCVCGWLALGPAWPFLSPPLVEIVVAVLLVAFAVAAGLQLPLLTVLSDTGATAATAARRVSAVLAGDYAGATAGALTAGTLLVPYLGAAGTLLLTSLCLALGLLLLRRRTNQ